MYLLHDLISPFTGNRCVVVEYEDAVDDRMMLCLDTGYVTYDKLWKEDAPYHDMMKEKMPELVWDTRRIEDGRVWYKMCISSAVVDLRPEIVDGIECWVVCAMKSVSDAGDNHCHVVHIDVAVQEVLTIIRIRDTANRIVFDLDDFSGAFSMCNEIAAVETESLELEIAELKESYIQNKGVDNETGV